MRWAVFLRIWFILYCIEAGVFLVLAPWSPAWDRLLLHLPGAHLLLLGGHPALRGGITGFGIVHLVWGAHDLDRLLTLWRQRRALRPS